MSISNLNKLAMLNLGGFEKRPHFGKLGKKLKIITNFFEIENLPSITIYQLVPGLSVLSFFRCFELFGQLLIFRFDVNITPDVPPILNR